MKNMDFSGLCWNIVKKVPRGKVTTYKEVAKAVGNSEAFRAVGNAMNKSPGIKKGVPCHRVVRSDGKIGGFALGAKKKIEMLKKEGVELKKNRIDLKRYEFLDNRNHYK